MSFSSLRETWTQRYTWQIFFWLESEKREEDTGTRSTVFVLVFPTLWGYPAIYVTDPGRHY
jgi:hypothetical protein